MHRIVFHKLTLLGLVLTVAMALGLGLGWAGHPSFQPEPVYAACQAAHAVCPFGDPTRTSLMTAHYYESGVGPVLPTSGTTWDITANWSRPLLACGDYSETASVTVIWDTSLPTPAWVISSSTLTTNIVGVALCNTADCATSAASYTLYVDINDPATVGGTAFNIRDVNYATNGGVPNGTLCMGGAKTPINGSASGTDTAGLGAWGGRCAYNCSHSNGLVLNLTYQ